MTRTVRTVDAGGTSLSTARPSRAANSTFATASSAVRSSQGTRWAAPDVRASYTGGAGGRRPSRRCRSSSALRIVVWARWSTTWAMVHSPGTTMARAVASSRPSMAASNSATAARNRASIWGPGMPSARSVRYSMARCRSGERVIAAMLVSSVIAAPRSSEDDGLAVEAKHLAVHVGDLAEAHVVLDGIDEDRHDVAAVAAGVGELLEARLHPGRVATRLHAPDRLDLFQLDRLVDLEEIDRLPLGHRVLVDADHDLLVPVVHELVAIGGVGDLLLGIACVDGGDHAAHGVDPLDVLQGRGLHPVGHPLQVVRASQGVDGEGHPGLLRDDLLGAQGHRDRFLGGQGPRLVVRVGVQGLGAPQH